MQKPTQSLNHERLGLDGCQCRSETHYTSIGRAFHYLGRHRQSRPKVIKLTPSEHLTESYLYTRPLLELLPHFWIITHYKGARIRVSGIHNGIHTYIHDACSTRQARLRLTRRLRVVSLTLQQVGTLCVLAGLHGTRSRAPGGATWGENNRLRMWKWGGHSGNQTGCGAR